MKSTMKRIIPFLIASSLVTLAVAQSQPPAQQPQSLADIARANKAKKAGTPVRVIDNDVVPSVLQTEPAKGPDKPAEAADTKDASATTEKTAAEREKEKLARAAQKDDSTDATVDKDKKVDDQAKAKDKDKDKTADAKDSATTDKAAKKDADQDKDKDKKDVAKKSADFQQKIDAQKKEIAILERELDVLQRETRLRAAAFYGDAGTQLRDQAKYAEESRKSQEDMDNKTKALDDAKQKLADLEEQERKAGGS